MPYRQSSASPPSRTVTTPGLTPQLLARIRGQYREMPGLRLTLQQARRLLGLDTMTCAAALAVLERAGFLATTRDGRFVLAENGPA